MKKNLIFLLSLPLLLGACSLPLFQNNKSALQITSQSTVSVYLNGNHVGQTPFFDDNLKPGEYTVRLLMDNDPTKDWQVKVNLTPKLVTVIDRQFGASDDLSSYYILQLEPANDSVSSEISIITIPDTVIVKIDGQPRGFSPVTANDLTAGDHLIMLAAPGYQELSIPAQSRNGYKLTVTAQLAKTPGLEVPRLPLESINASASASESANLETDTVLTPTQTSKVLPPTPTVKKTNQASASAEVARPYVQINETGTGWLRVRAEPTQTSKEVAKVDVGKRYPFFETSDNGWHKIEYESGQEGWVAGSYATVYR